MRLHSAALLASLSPLSRRLRVSAMFTASFTTGRTLPLLTLYGLQVSFAPKCRHCVHPNSPLSVRSMRQAPHSPPLLPPPLLLRLHTKRSAVMFRAHRGCSRGRVSVVCPPPLSRVPLTTIGMQVQRGRRSCQSLGAVRARLRETAVLPGLHRALGAAAGANVCHASA